MVPCCVFHQYLHADDFYVSKNGNDAGGTGSRSGPWRTITHALSVITGTSGNPQVIHISQGIYSPDSTGEIYPLVMKSYISLEGVGDSLCILEPGAQFRSRGITCNGCSHLHITGITIRYGSAPASDSVNAGGGMYITNSSFIQISNDNVADNGAYNLSRFNVNEGGGIYISNSSLIDVSN